MKKQRHAPLAEAQLRYAAALAAALFLSIFCIWLLYANLRAAKPQVSQAPYPATYSDTHITKNAILADPRFSYTTKFPRRYNLANVLNSRQKKEVIASSYRKEENGTWLWMPILDITPQYRDFILSGAKENKVNSIYLSIDSYLDIFVLPEGEEKTRKKAQFSGVLRDFIAKANEAGMSVDAVAGWRNWAESGHEYKAFAILDYAIEYNRAYEDRFRGVQYDVEPYLLPSYTENKRAVLRNFISLIDEIAARLERSDLELSVVIPEFYDAEDTPRFFYNLKYGYTIDHLFSVLERKPGSTLVVMAYRNTALGENGAIDISKGEMEKAARYKSRVVIAQEVGEIPAPNISFFGKSRAYYDEQVGIIRTTFSRETNYAGTATHYINLFLTLK